MYKSFGLVTLILYGCQTGGSTPSGGDRNDAADRASTVQEFVQRTYIHGVPYEEALRFGRENIPILLDMLKDRKEELSWSNIVVTLCIIGDDTVAKPVVEFIDKGPAGNIPDGYYAAKSNAVMALGYLINKTGNKEALTYLKQSVDPKAWPDRKVEWKAEFQATDDERNAQLSTMAVLGLALSGHPEAGEALRKLQRQPETPTQKAFAAAVTNTLAEALKDHEKIAGQGLREYYRKSKP